MNSDLPTPSDSANIYSEYFSAAEVATERVATLINSDFKCNNLFCQMDVLRTFKDDLVWKEMARWIRYEEAVEEGGERWSKPHVASLMMEALQDLQNILSTCPMLLDSFAMNMAEIADEITRAWIREKQFPAILKERLVSILLKQHKFQFYVKKSEQKKKQTQSTNKSIGLHSEAYENKAFDAQGDYYKLQIPQTDQPGSESPSLALGQLNKNFLRKIPQGSEAVNLLIGEFDDLDRIMAVFVRLKIPRNLGYITEVDLNTKFLFILLAPQTHIGHCIEMGRCMGALFTDEIFRCVAYRAETRTDILAGIQEFTLHLTVLPPGVWNPMTRIEPPDEVPSQDYRKTHGGGMIKSKSAASLASVDDKKSDETSQQEECHTDPTLVRTGRPFGGLLDDIKRKLPFYWSDYKDALHIQCVASFFFLFLVTLTPNVTFGGLLGLATDQYMGTMECILSSAISGVLFALFAGQPLNILGSTGPMLVLEGILYRFCRDQDWDFLPFRAWVGFWTGLFTIAIVAWDLSALVRYITRFTEESFACLIALIFIYEAFKKTFEIERLAPVRLHPSSSAHKCFCVLGNSSVPNFTYIDHNTTEMPFFPTSSFYVNSTLLNTSNFLYQNHSETELSDGFARDCSVLGGYIAGGECDNKYVSDVFMFSLLLFIGTFILAMTLVEFRHSLFFPTFIRQNVSDFAVLLSIIIMVVVDNLCGLPTPKLLVPDDFKPTKPGRPWVINPISDKNPWWLIILSIVPALLATILIFMDQQITAVIVNRRENKLKKGAGYHLDMLIIGVLVILFGLLGLPWFVAATVSALAHIMSLRKVSECTAPGEKPVFLGVREQRVTALLVAILSGLAVLFTSVLRYIPMPVLYGVFLYMGVAPLGGMQLVQRVFIVFMPVKYQPDYSFIRNVPIRRVHLFTIIQVVCLVVLWVVKSIESISIAFPLMVLFIGFIRKALDKVFTQRELKWLDDILPARHVKREGELPESKDVVRIKITTDENQQDQRNEAEKDKKALNDEVTEAPSRGALKQRMSLTFEVKTDLDKIKAMSPEIITDRRKSLMLAVDRRKSLQLEDGSKLIPPERKPFGRKLSCEIFNPSFPNGVPQTVDEHNRLNRIVSLPATITDEDETDSESTNLGKS